MQELKKSNSRIQELLDKIDRFNILGKECRTNFIVGIDPGEVAVASSYYHPSAGLFSESIVLGQACSTVISSFEVR
jgi:hypothetical protein